ncbi:MAG: hypothetical protein OEY38_15910 [Gammaproteobacteria bacterium]|nr:hypothetical protein [Gammaproteobacteria bacterium]
MNDPTIPSPSTMHSKITGDFGEHLVLYWLSKLGYESLHVDHSGIDILARDPRKKMEPLGISVKGRSRTIKNSNDSLKINADNITKIVSACDSFRCAPYFAIVMDGIHYNNRIKLFVFLFPMDDVFTIVTSKFSSTQDLIDQYSLADSNRRNNMSINWAMNQKAIDAYKTDKRIHYFELTYGDSHWVL